MSSKTTQTKTHEFKVIIDSMQLPEETVARLNEALQKATLVELASADLRGNQLVCTPIMEKMIGDAGGGTGGIKVKILSLKSEM